MVHPFKYSFYFLGQISLVKKVVKCCRKNDKTIGNYDTRLGHFSKRSSFTTCHISIVFIDFGKFRSKFHPLNLSFLERNWNLFHHPNHFVEKTMKKCKFRS